MLPWRQKDKFMGFVLSLNYAVMLMAFVVGITENLFLLHVYLAMLCVWVPCAVISWFRSDNVIKALTAENKILEEFDTETQDPSELPPEIQENLQIARARRILRESRDDA